MEIKNNAPCYVCWFATIFLAVTSAILIADLIKVGIASMAMVQITNNLTGKVYNPDPSKILKSRTAKKDMSGYRTSKEMCDFWKSEYRTDTDVNE